MHERRATAQIRTLNFTLGAVAHLMTDVALLVLVVLPPPPVLLWLLALICLSVHIQALWGRASEGTLSFA